jgi:acetoin utilization deacetylase AcuC-like enzyme
MQTDYSEDELAALIEDVEYDVGVVKESVRRILDRKDHDVMAINTHPGHHASPQRVAGMCIVNNVALAVKLIKLEAPHLKLGVIDIDVHPGDGTKKFLDRHVGLVERYISIHSAAMFWNMCCDLGASGIALRLDSKRQVSAKRLISKIKNALTTWNQAHLDIVVVALGFDTLKNDRSVQLGFQMLPVHFQEVGHVFAKRPEQILFLQEGGYNLDETADAFDRVVKGFREGRRRQMP